MHPPSLSRSLTRVFNWDEICVYPYQPYKYCFDMYWLINNDNSIVSTCINSDNQQIHANPNDSFQHSGSQSGKMIESFTETVRKWLAPPVRHKMTQVTRPLPPVTFKNISSYRAILCLLHVSPPTLPCDILRPLQSFRCTRKVSWGTRLLIVARWPASTSCVYASLT
jgi:hypothetical protein